MPGDSFMWDIYAPARYTKEIDAGEYGRFIIAEEWEEVRVGTYPTQQNKDFVELEGGELRHMIV